MAHKASTEFLHSFLSAAVTRASSHEINNLYCQFKSILSSTTEAYYTVYMHVCCLVVIHIIVTPVLCTTKPADLRLKANGLRLNMGWKRFRVFRELTGIYRAWIGKRDKKAVIREFYVHCDQQWLQKVTWFANVPKFNPRFETQTLPPPPSPPSRLKECWTHYWLCYWCFHPEGCAGKQIGYRQ